VSHDRDAQHDAEEKWAAGFERPLRLMHSADHHRALAIPADSAARHCLQMLSLRALGL